jgi:hypothetical protein
MKESKSSGTFSGVTGKGELDLRQCRTHSSGSIKKSGVQAGRGKSMGTASSARMSHSLRRIIPIMPFFLVIRYQYSAVQPTDYRLQDSGIRLQV